MEGTGQWISGVPNKAIGWGTALIGLAGVAYYGMRQANLIMDFCYDIKKFKVNRLDKGNLSTSCVIRLKNQSNIGTAITSYNFDIYLFDKKITNVKNEQLINIEANGVSEIPVDINVELLNSGLKTVDILNIANYYFTDKSKITFTYQGSLWVKLFGFIPWKASLTINDNLESLLSESNTPSTCSMEDEG